MQEKIKKNKPEKIGKKLLVVALIITFSFLLMRFVFPENNFVLPILSIIIWVAIIYLFLLIIDYAKTKGFKIKK